MVLAKILLSQMGNQFGNDLERSLPSHTRRTNRFSFRFQKLSVIGILAFETAKTMSRLVSMYKSLSDSEFLKLRNEIMKSEGVAYLNSRDERFLLNLACEEKIEDLDRAAAAVWRLGKKCTDPALQGFEHVYGDIRKGFIDFQRLEVPAKEMDRKIKKMEKYVSATASLYAGLEILTEMEVSERKLQQWKSYSGPIAIQKANSELFDQKLAWQRSHVRRMRVASLWSKSFDKIVCLMAQAVYTVYAKICFVFGPYVSDISPVTPTRIDVRFSSQQLRCYPNSSSLYASGPLQGPNPAPAIPKCANTRKSTPASRFRNKERSATCQSVDFCFDESRYFGFGNRKRNISSEASRATVGGSGLALRYANVVILAEKLLNFPESVVDDMREDLYELLPSSLKGSMKTKLKKCFKEEGRSGLSDDLLAHGWRDVLGRILGWLAPMAHDMLRWQSERNFEKQCFDSRPNVLLLQTLYFSDKVKTEAAIAEVLVGLSCICRYQNRKRCSDDLDDRNMFY